MTTATAPSSGAAKDNVSRVPSLLRDSSASIIDTGETGTTSTRSSEDGTDGPSHSGSCCCTHSPGLSACCYCIVGSLCCGALCVRRAAQCSGSTLLPTPARHPLHGVLAPPDSACAFYGPKVAWCVAWVTCGVLLQVLALPESVFPASSSPYATESAARRLVSALLLLGAAFLCLSATWLAAFISAIVSTWHQLRVLPYSLSRFNQLGFSFFVWQQLLAVLFIVTLNLLPVITFLVNAAASGLTGNDSSSGSSSTSVGVSSEGTPSAWSIAWGDVTPTAEAAQRLAALLRQLTSTGLSGGGSGSGSTDLGELFLVSVYALLLTACYAPAVTVPSEEALLGQLMKGMEKGGRGDSATFAGKQVVRGAASPSLRTPLLDRSASAAQLQSTKLPPRRGNPHPHRHQQYLSASGAAAEERGDVDEELPPQHRLPYLLLPPLSSSSASSGSSRARQAGRAIVLGPLRAAARLTDALAVELRRATSSLLGVTDAG